MDGWKARKAGGPEDLVLGTTGIQYIASLQSAMDCKEHSQIVINNSLLETLPVLVMTVLVTSIAALWQCKKVLTS